MELFEGFITMAILVLFSEFGFSIARKLIEAVRFRFHC